MPQQAKSWRAKLHIPADPKKEKQAYVETETSVPFNQRKVQTSESYCTLKDSYNHFNLKTSSGTSSYTPIVLSLQQFFSTKKPTGWTEAERFYNNLTTISHISSQPWQIMGKGYSLRNNITEWSNNHSKSLNRKTNCITNTTKDKILNS